MRSENRGLVRAGSGGRSLALAMLAGLLLVGPVQSEAGAATCEAPDEGTHVQSAVALASHAVDVQPGLNETEIRWTRWNTRVTFGASAVLEGQVVTQDGAIPDATVDLLAKEAGSRQWTELASTVSDSDTAVFSFSCLRPPVTTVYRVVYHGALLQAGSEGRRTVGVARRVSDSMTQVAANLFRFKGSVDPRYVARTVLLQRKSCSGCRWSDVARSPTSSRSAWRFAVDVSGFTGDRWYRAAVPGDDSYVRSYSARTCRLTHG